MSNNSNHSAAQPAGSAADQRPFDPHAALADGHLARLSGLLQRAEALASAMLGDMEQRAQSRQPVFPGELVQVCRGLVFLARCGVELRRQLKAAGHTAAQREPRGITEADITRLEERLRPLFTQRAA